MTCKCIYVKMQVRNIFHMKSPTSATQKPTCDMSYKCSERISHSAKDTSRMPQRLWRMTAHPIIKSRACRSPMQRRSRLGLSPFGSRRLFALSPAPSSHFAWLFWLESNRHEMKKQSPKDHPERSNRSGPQPPLRSGMVEFLICQIISPLISFPPSQLRSSV